MKRLVTVLVVAASLILYPRSALADTLTLFTGLQASGTFACGTGGSASTPCELNGFYKVSIQFTCTSAPSTPCVDEIQVQQRNTSSDNWATVLDLFNTGANDLGYSNIGFGQIQVVVIYTQGTLQGTLQRLK